MRALKTPMPRGGYRYKPARKDDVALTLRLPAATAKLLRESAERRNISVEDAALRVITWTYYRGSPSKVLDVLADPRQAASLQGLKSEDTCSLG
jgi:hypothetical protein